MGEKAQARKPRAKRAITRPPQASGRVAIALWPQVAELRASGRSATQIAEAIGRDQSCVARTLKEPAVIADIERIQADRRGALEQDIRAAASEAWQVLRGCLRDEEAPGLRLKAATEILDRSGIVARKESLVIETSASAAPLPDLTTPAGMAALREQLAALPPGLLREALAARDEPA